MLSINYQHPAMGRIKSTMIKKAARQLLQLGIPFNESFEKDKKILGRNLPSKPIRNKVAGYIARLKRMEAVEKQKLQPKINDDN